MQLSPYHEKYASRSDEDIQMRADVKEKELEIIFEQVKPNFTSEPLRIFVVGCGEKRLIRHHKRIFEKLTGKHVVQTTSDITIDHLVGEEGVVQHDGTLPLPGGPYDIVYAHVFLKFVEPERQWDVLKNSYDALADGGIAIHVFDREEVDTTEQTISDGMFSVDLNKINARLTERSIDHEVVEWTIGDILPSPLLGLALVLKK